MIVTEMNTQNTAGAEMTTIVCFDIIKKMAYLKEYTVRNAFYTMLKMEQVKNIHSLFNQVKSYKSFTRT